MEFTLATIKEFLKPFFDAHELDINNVFSVAFEPGGVEIVQYERDKDGDFILIGDSVQMKSDFYKYLA